MSNTITLNGIVYDRDTGEAIGPAKQTIAVQSDATARTQSQPATAMHAKTQRSKTLSRQYVKRLAADAQKVKKAAAQPAPARQENKKSSQKIAVFNDTRPQQIRRFAKHPIDITAARPDSNPAPERAPTIHPMVQRVHEKRAAQQPATVTSTAKPSEVIKREAIDNAMSKTQPNSHGHRRHKTKQKQSPFARIATLASAGTALLLIAGYFTYLNMPNLSVRVAAAQAGVEAEYPSYRPSGYSLNGPVAYNQGQVSMTFASNGGPNQFRLVQSKSGWDSSAVLDNYVTPKAGENYVTSRDSGLTIYTFGNDAAWVNNGILYTIDGDAELSLQQVQRMATSL